MLALWEESYLRPAPGVPGPPLPAAYLSLSSPISALPSAILLPHLPQVLDQQLLLWF